MLKKGVYRTREAGLTIEEHGGARIRHYVYLYLCFYLPEKNVGLYGTSIKNYFHPYLNHTIDLEGEITKQKKSDLEFYIFNRDTGVKMPFAGVIEGEFLRLRYYHEDKPEEV